MLTTTTRATTWSFHWSTCKIYYFPIRICLPLKLSLDVPNRNFKLHMKITTSLPSLDQQSVGNGNIHIGIPLKVNVGAAHPTCRPKSVKQTHHRPLPRGWTTSQILRSNSRCVWIVVCAVDTHTHTNKANARTHLSNGRAAARARLRARIVHRSEEQSEWPRESTMVQPIPSSSLKKEIGSFSNVQVNTTTEQNITTYKVNCATRSLGDSEVCKQHLTISSMLALT